MAHFAEIDADGIVLRVVVIHDNVAPDEATGTAFCKSLFGDDTEWVQTSYNGSARKQYCGKGYSYDRIGDVFVSPRPNPSWVKDSNHDWIPPKQKPDNGKKHKWDEVTQEWIEI